MKIAVVTNTVPFLRGGAEVLADALVVRLSQAGHTVDLVRLPFAWDPVERVADAMVAASLTALTSTDLAIALKFPAYLVPHENKVVWLLHQFRQFYDLWDTPNAGYRTDDPRVLEVRSMVHAADTEALRQANGLYSISPSSADRLRRFTGLHAEVLPHPLANPEAFFNAGTGDYVFAGGRINSFKRQLLAVQAMRYTTTDVRLVVAGAPEHDEDLARLLTARDASGQADRITIIPSFIDESQKADLVNHALACVYCPLDEDSYGYVTLEAAQASKPVVTTADSGGVTDLVIDGVSGVVCGPEPSELAAAFDTLYRSPLISEQLGTGAHGVMRGLGISWERVIERLTAS